MGEFFKHAAGIIKAAAANPLGIVALIVLALSALAYSFFGEETVWFKLGIFVLLALGFAGYVFSQRPSPQEDKRGETKPESPLSPALIAKPNVQISLRLPTTAGRHLFGRDEELARLDVAWADASTNVINLVAWGGVGKSALVEHWLAAMAEDGHRGAARVFGRSFYSQGVRESAASADIFIDDALRWFGDPEPEAGSASDKGERLADLVREQRTLLVLDGLEPMQHPPGPEEGRLKDPALAALLRSLAASNTGLCVVTTRVRVAEIKASADSTAPVVELGNLSDEAGSALLRDLDVTGAEEELRLASREFDGHGLALNLLGSYLRDVCGGDVRRRSEIRDLTEHAEQGGHARRVMESYEIWLGDGPELHVLRLLGLFDRPADGGSVGALRRPPAIDELTDRLAGLDEASWQQALARLRRARLLADPDPNDLDALDAHPLVREYFRDRLRDGHAAAWRAGNSRLYEHLTETAEDLPETIKAMAPLFAAVAHGCAAGRHQEALDDVYKRRIQRRNEFYSSKILGAVGAGLAALSGFFEPPYAHPVAALRVSDRAFVLGQAGIRLRELGRLMEAVTPTQAGLALRVEKEDWRNAAAAAVNLSELHVTLGGLQAALELARQGVAHADRSKDANQQMVNRTAMADALLQAGRAAEAAALFEKAEAMQKETQPDDPFLYSFRGFKYCGLLLDQEGHETVLNRVTKTMEIATQNNWLLDIALDHLSLGRASLLAVQAAGTDDFKLARSHLDHAVDGLRLAGQQHHIPRGLLARAALHRAAGDGGAARRDLDEAMEIAGRGPMRLHQTDAHLEYARLELDRGDADAARGHAEAAAALVAETGYHRRDVALAELREQLGGGD